MPEHCKILQLCNARKPDIVRYDPVTKSIEIVEITIGHDLYFEQGLNGKHEKYLHFLIALENFVSNQNACIMFWILRERPKKL